MKYEKLGVKETDILPEYSSVPLFYVFRDRVMRDFISGSNNDVDKNNIRGLGQGTQDDKLPFEGRIL